MPSKKTSSDQNANKAKKPRKTSPVKKTLLPDPTISASEAKPISTSKPLHALTPKEQRFVEEYLVDLNATQAYLRSHPGVKTTSASSESAKYLGNPWIQIALAKGRAAMSERTGITADRALEHAWLIATADARELIEYIVGCCRYCYGEGFKEQRTLAEFNAAREKSLSLGSSEPFDEKGGIGYDPRLDPHPLCTECFGKGHGRAYINDSRRFSPAAASLYAGVKITKDGIEVKMNSKLDALEKVFKHLGLYKEDNTQRTDPFTSFLAGIGKSVFPIVNTVPPDDDDDE